MSSHILAAARERPPEPLMPVPKGERAVITRDGRPLAELRAPAGPGPEVEPVVAPKALARERMGPLVAGMLVGRMRNEGWR